MTSNSLTENEENDIPSQILKTIFGLHASVIFLDTNMCGFQYNCWVLWSPRIPNSSGQLAKLIAYIIPPE